MKYKEEIRAFFIIFALILFIILFSRYANVVVNGKEYFSPLNPIAILYEFLLLFLIGFVVAQFISHNKHKNCFIREIEDDVNKEIKKLKKKMKKLF